MIKLLLATPMNLDIEVMKKETCKPLFDQNHWVGFPKPKLLDSIYQREDLSRPTLLDGEPVFEKNLINVIKHNNDLLYLVSNTGNMDWINPSDLERYCKENFGEEYNVHLLENVCAYIHIDTTFVFLREGLVLLNPTRVNQFNLPDFLHDFDKI